MSFRMAAVPAGEICHQCKCKVSGRALCLKLGIPVHYDYRTTWICVACAEKALGIPRGTRKRAEVDSAVADLMKSVGSSPT